ncbi:DUF4865 family protein [Saccharothrix longispora]|uniref:DUF4865 domain-containing protein n=1 Tax=Saccharothrix longispora TaxID=33920 RepID=A0ABU1PXM8_9PSEU|nr:DUF4865 family protein [Saccharothrix longispora]MDR6594894.1 hypothetical protein [Saccharothrix longispora]
MHATQYEITLPADYDMGVIRHRVATRGSALDDFPGLGLKAHRVRERGVDGSPVNHYAPFYLWRTTEGMDSFPWGPGFAGIRADFARPAVRDWVGPAFHRGPAGDVAHLTRRTVAVPQDATPDDLVDEAPAESAALAAHPGVHASAVAVDPDRWEPLHVVLRSGEPDAGGTRYRVHHLSRPEVDGLNAGRHW